MSNNANFLSGAIRKCYTCNVCNEKFSLQGDLKRHRKNAHIIKETKDGEVEENCQTKEGGDQSVKYQNIFIMINTMLINQGEC